MNKKNIKTLKSASILGTSTLASRILGLVREQVRAIFLGTGIASDAFGVAFMIPNLLRKVVGEGAMSAAFIPVFTDFIKKREEEDLWLFAQRFFYFMTFAITILVILFVIFAPILINYVFAPGFSQVSGKAELTILLTRIMFVYILFIGLAALTQAMLNSFEKFFIPSLSPILLNIAVISSVFIFKDLFSNIVFAFATGVVIGGVLQLSIQIPSLKRLGMQFKPTIQFKDPGIKKVLYLLAPSLFGATVYEINIITSQLIASFLEPGSVSSLQFSSRILELTLGIFVVSVSTVILPRLSREAIALKYDEMKQTLDYALRLVLFVTIPATFGLIILRGPIVYTLFGYGIFNQKSVDLTSFALLFHAMGLVFIASARIIVPAYYSMKDTRTPVKVSAIAMATNILFCLVLAPFLGNGGIALANSISIAITLILLLYFLRSKLESFSIYHTIKKLKLVAISTLLMSIAAIFMVQAINIYDAHSILARIAIMIIMVMVPLSVFITSCYLLKSPELMEFLDIVSKKLKKKAS
ncbi:MAG: murein biosynthesis integral membrane protein MurJ [Pseudomonadota bacterium]